VLIPTAHCSSSLHYFGHKHALSWHADHYYWPLCFFSAARFVPTAALTNDLCLSENGWVAPTSNYK
jgi:hypothetical protein